MSSLPTTCAAADSTEERRLSRGASRELEATQPAHSTAADFPSLAFRDTPAATWAGRRRGLRTRECVSPPFCALVGKVCNLFAFSARGLLLFPLLLLVVMTTMMTTMLPRLFHSRAAALLSRGDNPDCVSCFSGRAPAADRYQEEEREEKKPQKKEAPWDILVRVICTHIYPYSCVYLYICTYISVYVCIYKHICTCGNVSAQDCSPRDSFRLRQDSLVG